MVEKSGLTIIEVVIAVSVLAIGVLAMAGLQSSSLQGTRDASINQEIANLAYLELELQRSFRRVTEQEIGGTCRTFIGDEVGEPGVVDKGQYTCAVRFYPCQWEGTGLKCLEAPQSVSSEDRVATQVTVTVTGPGGRRFAVSTVVR